MTRVDAGFIRDKSWDPRTIVTVRYQFNDRGSALSLRISSGGDSNAWRFSSVCAQPPRWKQLAQCSLRDRRAEVEDRRSWFGPIIEIRAAHVSAVPPWQSVARALRREETRAQHRPFFLKSSAWFGSGAAVTRHYGVCNFCRKHARDLKNFYVESFRKRRRI